MPLAGLLVGLKPCLWSKTTSTKTCTQGDSQLSDRKKTRENAVDLSVKSHDHNSILTNKVEGSYIPV